MYYYLIDSYVWSQLQSDLSETPIQFVHPLSIAVFAREAPFGGGGERGSFISPYQERNVLPEETESVLF